MYVLILYCPLHFSRLNFIHHSFNSTTSPEECAVTTALTTPMRHKQPAFSETNLLLPSSLTACIGTLHYEPLTRLGPAIAAANAVQADAWLQLRSAVECLRIRSPLYQLRLEGALSVRGHMRMRSVQILSLLSNVLHS
jgi:hypothetical protein